MAFQIPDNALNPLAEFIALPEPQAIQLINAVREAQPALGMWRFAESVAAKSGLDVQKVETILSTFAGLHLVRTASDRPLDEFVSDLSNALRKLGDPRFVPSDWGNFEEALKAILGSEDSLGVSAKGLDLLLDNERGLHSVRIVTDVRHVFGADPKERPKASVIVHRLNIVYHEMDGMKEVYYSLDGSDLEDLKIAIERAEIKERTLETMLNEFGLNCLSAER